MEFIGEIGKLALPCFSLAFLTRCAPAEVLVKSSGEILCGEVDFSDTVGLGFLVYLGIWLQLWMWDCECGTVGEDCKSVCPPGSFLLSPWASKNRTWRQCCAFWDHPSKVHWMLWSKNHKMFYSVELISFCTEQTFCYGLKCCNMDINKKKSLQVGGSVGCGFLN